MSSCKCSLGASIMLMERHEWETSLLPPASCTSSVHGQMENQCSLCRELCGGRGWEPGSLRSKPDSPWVPEAGNSPPLLLRRVESSAWSYSNLGGESVPSDACEQDFGGGWSFSAYTGEGQRVSCLFCKIESWFYDDKTSVDKKFGLWGPISLKSVRHVHTGWTCTWTSILFILNFLTEETNL